MINRKITDEYINQKIGEEYTNYQNCQVVIVDYINCENCTVLFDNKFLVANLQYGRIKRGVIKNPYHPSVFGIGFVGQGNHNLYLNNKPTKAYNTWRGMLERCYDKKYQEKMPTYIGCSVADEWLNFQVFAQWFEDNYNPETMQGWHLDKDILVKGNKVYSSETCCFVPQEINGIFTLRQNKRGDYPIGVLKIKNRYRVKLNVRGEPKHIGYFHTPEEAFQAYKKVKEEWIKEVADKWKNEIRNEVYGAMHARRVDITD